MKKVFMTLTGVFLISQLSMAQKVVFEEYGLGGGLSRKDVNPAKKYKSSLNLIQSLRNNFYKI